MVRYVAIGFEHGHIWGMLRGLAQDSEAKLTALADTNEQTLAQAKERHPDPALPAYRDYRTMLDEMQPDAAVLCPVNSEKGDVIVECINRGIHVFADKPFVTSETDIAQVEQALRRKPVQLTANFSYRYNPKTITVKQAIDSGRIGRPAYMIISVPHKLKINHRTEVMLNEDQNGGVLVDIVCHAYDLVRWYTGSELAEVTAYHANHKFTQRSDFKDNGQVLVRMQDGSTAMCAGDWLVPDEGKAKNIYFVAGTAGTLDIQGQEVIWSSYDRPPESLPLVKPSVSVHQDFLTAIRDRSYQPVQTTQDVVESMRGVILARRAADTGARICCE